MKHLIFFLLCALALGASLAQTDLERPILRVNGQVVTAQDLELVKSMLPLEKLKTSKGKSKLIDGIYTQFLIQKTLLEQAQRKITDADIAAYLRELPKTQKIPEGYTAQGYAAKQLYKRLMSASVLQRAAQNLAQNAQGSLPTDDDKKAMAEHWLSDWMTKDFNWGGVKARAILLDNPIQANQVEQLWRKGERFERLARRFSLVRANVGGSLSGDEQPHLVVLDYIEPELQVAIAQNPQQKKWRVNAPFGRVWLLELLETDPFNDSPQAYVNRQNASTLQNAITLDILVWSKYFEFDDIGGVEVLDAELSQTNPLVAQVGKEQRFLASMYASAFLIEDAEMYPKLEVSIKAQLEEWLDAQQIVQGIPYKGAGTAFGLLNYLAARVKVSEDQIKGFYNTTKKKYQIGLAFKKAAKWCLFNNPAYAADWQKVFSIVPAPYDWRNAISYPALSCFSDGDIDGLERPTYPEKPSKQSLRPIAGGYMTKVFQYRNLYHFFVLYDYLPAPMQKPYALVRGEVEREYRLLVAKKRLPEFERELRIRTGVKNLLEQVLKDLEQ